MMLLQLSVVLGLCGIAFCGYYQKPNYSNYPSRPDYSSSNYQRHNYPNSGYHNQYSHGSASSNTYNDKPDYPYNDDCYYMKKISNVKDYNEYCLENKIKGLYGIVQKRGPMYARKLYHKCRDMKHMNEKQQYCPNYGYAAYKYNCPAEYCHGVLYYAKSKCHGHVKLSKAFTTYEAFQCNSYRDGKPCQASHHGYNDGYSHQPGYRGQVRKTSASQCSCHTKTCEKKIEGCYKKGGFVYKDILIVEVPCGCSCYQGSYGHGRDHY